jgi:hypothetical protein
MKSVAVVIAILPLAIAVGACSRQGESGTGKSHAIVAPETPSQPLVHDAAWLSDRDAVAQAASAAAIHPLVRSVLANDPSRLEYLPAYALRGAGRTDRDNAISITILPYITNGDPTHATFISLLESGGEAAVSHAEILWGRDPRPDEAGYETFSVGGASGWIREDDLRMATVARDGSLSPERVNWKKFLTCFETLGPQLCSQGASIADQIAPTVPYHEAIGCAVGTAVAAVGCGAATWGK